MVSKRRIAMVGILCGLILLASFSVTQGQSNPQDTITVDIPTITSTANEPTLPTEPVVITPSILETDTPSPTSSLIVTGTPEPSFTPTPTVTIASTKPFIPPSGPKIRILVKQNGSASSRSTRLLDGKSPGDQAAIELQKIGVTIIEVPELQVEKTLADLQADPGVEFAEIDGEVQALDIIPNDPGFPSQYGLRNIHAPQGWSISTGSTAVIIAMIDSGVDLNHPDLIGKLVPGFNFLDNSAPPQDDYGHGTHTAGIAAASSNNGLGIAGVSWGARIMPIKILDSNGNGGYENLTAAIIWATDHYAQIINISLGGTIPSSALKNAVTYAIGRGVMIVAAAGNDGSSQLRYPAWYRQVVAVGSTNSLNQRSGFSNMGKDLDLMAPGDSIYSTMPGGYGTHSGTSMSTAFVSGLAAVLWGMPGNGSAYRVESKMERSALDLGPAGWDVQYGFGLIQMDAALKLLNPTATPTRTIAESPNNISTIVIHGMPFFQSTPTPTIQFGSTLTIMPTNILTTLTITQTATSAFTESQTPLLTLTAVASPSANTLGNWLPLFCGVGLILMGVMGMVWAGRLKKIMASKNEVNK